MLFFWAFYSLTNREKLNHTFHKNMKQPKQFSALVIITIINNWAPIITGDNISANQHMRIISEESCDTEDWRNDVENSALIIEI